VKEIGGRGDYNLRMPVTRDQIRAYYDQNTRLFLAFNRISDSATFQALLQLHFFLLAMCCRSGMHPSGDAWKPGTAAMFVNECH